MTSEIPAINTLNTRRGVKALRITTRVLREIADRLETTALLAVAVLTIAATFHAGPAWTQMDRGTFTVAIFAAWGAAKFSESTLYGAADWIDPDARDGDSAFLVAEVLNGLTDDIRHGADHDDVLIGLQASQVLPALHTVLGALGDAFDEGGESEEAADLYAAGIAVRSAARRLGAKSA